MGIIESKREYKTVRIRFNDGYRAMIFFFSSIRKNFGFNRALRGNEK